MKTYCLVISLILFNFAKGSKQWNCVKGKGKSNYYRPLRKNSNGDTECGTRRSNKCFFTKDLKVCQKFKPKGTLTCGSEHNRIFGKTGYEDPDHWCKWINFVNQDYKNRIVLGNDTEVDEYPFIARIMVKQKRKRKQWCGGSIIDEKWIMTAAHCVFPGEKRRDGKYVHFDSYKVLVGAHGWEDGLPIPVKPRNIYAHPDYDAEYKINDIALIEIPKRYAKILDLKDRIAQINSEPIDTFNAKLIVAGWGLLQQSSYSRPISIEDNTPDVLKKTELDAVDFTECQRILLQTELSTWGSCQRGDFVILCFVRVKLRVTLVRIRNNGISKLRYIITNMLVINR